MSSADVNERAGTAREHLQVARERLDYVAELDAGTAEAQVAASNAILAGIAAADAICGKSLGERSNDSDHRAAVALLSTVSPGGADLSRKLSRLLSDKSQLQYGGYVTRGRAEKAVKWAQHLVDVLGTFGVA